MTAHPPPHKGSPIRYVAGMVCLLSALVVLAGGFAQMVIALETGGYGTSRITYALGVLGAGGGLLATGIAVLIWEYSIRYGVRH